MHTLVYIHTYAHMIKYVHKHTEYTQTHTEKHQGAMASSPVLAFLNYEITGLCHNVHLELKASISARHGGYTFKPSKLEAADGALPF